MIRADDLSGFCAACLLETGLNLLTGDAAEQAREPVLAEFGDYELLEEIGRGGQGVIYRARQKSLNRLVALKVIGLGHWATATHLKRFRREAEAAASLEHPGIVPIYEIGEHDGACFFSMQFIEGGRLDEFVRREPLPLRRAVEIIASLARTVSYAHERGIIHRDIKPGNILLDVHGEPHLADFGLARLVETESTVTRTRDVLGTPSYIAPEQAAGKSAELTSATDVYGLGAVFYQLLTGHPPFAGGTTYETIRLVLETEPRSPRLWNPKVDRDLTTICLKCLEKDPQRRYPSARALAEDLERWLGHEPIQARRTGVVSRSGKWIRRNPTMAVLLPLLLALSAAIGMLFWNREPARPPAGIAVLPFENLDGDKADTVFADGIQEDILTKLAKVADLKVISRTSVMQYRGARNTRQIGEALHVSYVLEGSVRRDGGRIRLNTQLIDTRTDQHVWAEEYDRALTDVFVAQTEIAQQIADELQVKLSPSEKAALAEQPTKDLTAYDLYVCASAIIESAPTAQDLFRVIELLNKALARDPSFLFAYCKLASAHDDLYLGLDHTPERLALAESAVNSALRLGPDSGEAHLALALHFYWGYFDYDRARAELAVAGRTLPNDPRIAFVAGLIDRRQGRWSEAVRELARATELDPRNGVRLWNLATTYLLLRDYKHDDETLDRWLALDPNNIDARIARAALDIRSRGDTRPLHAVLEKIRAENPAAVNDLAGATLWVAIYERDAVTASHALTELTESMDWGPTGDMRLPRSFSEGLIARMKGDAVAARAAFVAARAEQEKLARAQPDHGLVLCALGLIDAQLGRSQDALREGRRAVEVIPVAKSSLEGTDVLYSFAKICAWTGERDLALGQLEKLVKIPAGPSYGDLRLDPSWDSLRGDPRFDTIVASLAPANGGSNKSR
ncbi:MAG TPA: protein kinase [Chthoniobacterales bacterium]